MPEPIPPAASRRRAVPAGVLAFLAFFLIIGAWSFAAPYDGTPDERQHIYRAAGVTAGQVFGTQVTDERGSGALQTVPSGLVRDDGPCWHYQQGVPASCAAGPGSSSQPEEVLSLAGRYNPLYYAIVGLPLNIWPGWGGVIGARLISAAGTAALLALAFSMVTRVRRPLMIAAMVILFTPLMAQMGSAINPSGWEMAAGIALFAAGIRIFLAPPEERTAAAVWLFTISAVLIAVMRSAGPMLLFFAMLALALPLSRARIAGWWADTRLRKSAIAIGAAIAIAITWLVAVHPGELSTKPMAQSWSLPQAMNYQLKLWENYIDELVGIMSWLDVSMQGPVYQIWQGAAFTLIFLALAAGAWAGRARLVIIVLGGVVIPSILQIAAANSAGFVLQGRYVFPLLAGLPLIAAYILEDRGFPAAWSVPLTRMFAIMLLPLHLAFLAYTMLRWQNGLDGRVSVGNIFGGQWEPVSGSLLPLVMVTAGVILLAWLYWRTAASGPARARLKPHGAGE